jgi:hypothetical protein
MREVRFAALGDGSAGGFGVRAGSRSHPDVPRPGGRGQGRLPGTRLWTTSLRCASPRVGPCTLLDADRGSALITFRWGRRITPGIPALRVPMHVRLSRQRPASRSFRDDEAVAILVEGSAEPPGSGVQSTRKTGSGGDKPRQAATPATTTRGMPQFSSWSVSDATAQKPALPPTGTKSACPTPKAPRSPPNGSLIAFEQEITPTW